MLQGQQGNSQLILLHRIHLTRARVCKPRDVALRARSRESRSHGCHGKRLGAKVKACARIDSGEICPAGTVAVRLERAEDVPRAKCLRNANHWGASRPLPAPGLSGLEI